ncbi:YfjI family protein [Paraburkholderia phymatum]|uniref:YfjI family protein n=1 Tax=Paraburkholderia phymatum TaxID=148447 RepID=A0ACC6TSH9_9BURK
MMEFGNQFESPTACEATTEAGSAAGTVATTTGDDAQSTVPACETPASHNDGRKPPFPDYVPRTDFPWQALPETIRGAVLEICNNDKLAVPLAVQAVLTAVSLACQDLVLVDRGIGGDPSVCSLFMLAVADSGARKTRADRAVTPVIEVYDQVGKADYERKKAAYQNELKARQDKERALQRTLASLTRKAHCASAEEAQEAEASLENVERLLQELRSQPFTNAIPLLRRVLYSAIAMRDLERSLCQNWPSAGLISSEAADILTARSESDMARLDRLWDGQRIDVVGRSAKESFSVADPRLTVSLMIQPTVFDRFLARKGESAKGIGFMPRTLISRAETPYGDRMADSSVPRSTAWIERFNKRVTDLLEHGRTEIEKRAQNRMVLSFAPAAQQLWESDQNEKEAQTVEGGQYVHEREFVNRYSEHVARLAALFHFFERGYTNAAELPSMGGLNQLEIPDHTVASAIEVCEWYLSEFSRIFNPDMVMEEVAGHVLQKLKERLSLKNDGKVPDEYAMGYQNAQFEASELRNFCTRFGLRKDLMLYKSALTWLQERRKILLVTGNTTTSTRQTMFVRLNIEIRPGSWRQQRY